MANTPKTQTTTTTTTTTPAADANLSKVLAAMDHKPQAVMSAVQKMVLAVAASKGIDFASLTAGRKAAFTKDVKAAMKAAGLPV